MELNPNNIPKLEYSTVQFRLVNPTPNSVEVEIDTNTLTNINTAPVIGVYPNTLGQQISVGTTYDGLTFDTTRNNIITGDASGNIRVIDASSRQVLYSTTSTVASERMIYIDTLDVVYSIGKVGISGNIVAVINPSDGTEITTVTIPTIGVTFSDLVYCPTNGIVYLKDGSADQRIWFLNSNTNTIIGSILPAGITLNIEYVSSNDSVYIFDLTGSIYQLSCTTNTIVATIGGAGTAVLGSYSSDNDQIYYQDSAASVIKIVNVASNTIIGTTIAGFAGAITDMAYSGNTNHIFIVHEGADAIKIVDATSNAVVTSLAIPADWDGNIVYANTINTAYTSPNSPAAGDYIQEITASGSQFYVEGSTNINLFIRDTLTNPKAIDRIMIYGEENSNLLEPLKLTKEDANGLACSYVKLPNITAATNQYQGQIGQLDFEQLYVLDVTAILNYTVPAFTTITWVVYYKEYQRGDLLSGKVMLEEHDVKKPYDPDTYDEKYLMETALRPSFETNDILNLN